MSWPPPGPGTTETRRSIGEAILGRPDVDPRDKLRREIWRVLYPLCSSAGWRLLRDGKLDQVLDLAEAAYKEKR